MTIVGDVLTVNVTFEVKLQLSFGKCIIFIFFTMKYENGKWKQEYGKVQFFSLDIYE